MTTAELITRIIGYIAGAMLGIWLYNNFSLEKILKKCGKRSNYEIKDSEMKEIDDDEAKNLLEPIAKKLHVGKNQGT